MTSTGALDHAIETIVVDCYNEDEAYTAFLAVIDDEVALPTPASVLGSPVTVVRLEHTDAARGLVAVCHRPHGTGEVAFADLAFPADTLAAWLHAAYRHHLGLKPFPAICGNLGLPGGADCLTRLSACCQITVTILSWRHSCCLAAS